MFAWTVMRLIMAATDDLRLLVVFVLLMCFLMCLYMFCAVAQIASQRT